MFDNTDLIVSYSRAQAIADGVLIDVTPIALRLNFRIPVALTCGVQAAVSNGAHSDTEILSRVQDTLAALRTEVRTAPSNDRCTFSLSFPGLTPIEMWALCGPGDTADPVITVMLPYED